MQKKKYYIGLDIGTNSVGYAVTDTEYNLIKTHGKSAWGVTAFDEASGCVERTSFRTGRRRRDRIKFRVQLLQELFALEIAKMDEKFYERLQKSHLYREEVGESYTLFCDASYTDVEYYRHAARAVQHQNAEPCVKKMLGVVGVPCAAAGVKAQPPHRHGGVLGLFRHLGLDQNRFGIALLGGQLCQQLRPDAVGAVGGHYGKIIQLAHPAALRPHH